MRFNRVVRASDSKAEVAIVLGSIPASSDTVESEGRQMKQCWIQYIITKKSSLKKKLAKTTSAKWSADGRLYLAHPGPLPAGEGGGVGGGEGEGAAGGAPTRPLLLLCVQRQPAPPDHVYKVVIISQVKKTHIRLINVLYVRWHLVMLITDCGSGLTFSAPCGAGSFKRLD